MNDDHNSSAQTMRAAVDRSRMSHAFRSNPFDRAHCLTCGRPADAPSHALGSFDAPERVLTPPVGVPATPAHLGDAGGIPDASGTRQDAPEGTLGDATHAPRDDRPPERDPDPPARPPTHPYVPSIEHASAWCEPTRGGGLEKRGVTRAVVRHADGSVAWRGPTHWDDAKRVAGHTVRSDCERVANKAAKQLAAYLERTGNRWEHEQAAKAAAASARKRRDERIDYLKKQLAMVPKWRRELRAFGEASTKRKGGK